MLKKFRKCEVAFVAQVVSYLFYLGTITSQRQEVICKKTLHIIVIFALFEHDVVCLPILLFRFLLLMVINGTNDVFCL